MRKSATVRVEKDVEKGDESPDDVPVCLPACLPGWSYDKWKITGNEGRWVV